MIQGCKTRSFSSFVNRGEYIRMLYGRTPCPKFGNLSVKLKFYFFQGKNNFEKNVNGFSLRIVNFFVACLHQLKLSVRNSRIPNLLP